MLKNVSWYKEHFKQFPLNEILPTHNDIVNTFKLFENLYIYTYIEWHVREAALVSRILSSI